MDRSSLQPPDLREKGGPRDGEPQALDRRLFVQLLVFGGCRDAEPLVDVLARLPLEAVLYEDLHDPLGVGVLLITESPAVLLDEVRPHLTRGGLAGLRLKPELTMLGRTYAIGYEPDLEDVLLHRPRRTALNPDWPWAVWYPLRRTSAFEQLPLKEQRKVLSEHGEIGMAYGRADLVHDVRLACHGLDAHDNDFVVGLVGKELFPLSHIVQRMRRTRQTSEFLSSLGPFFVGRARWRSPYEGAAAG